MVPLFSRKSMLFLLLGVFALLFGIVGEVSAGLCEDETGWKNVNFSCDINYTDLGGANLETCKYRIVSNGVETLSWTDASGTCSGEGPAILQASVTVGPIPKSCRDNGSAICKIYAKATDNSGNVYETPVATPINSFDIDYTRPTVTINQASGQADPTNVSPINFTAVFSESVTGFTDTDVSFAESTAGGTLTASVTPASGTTYNVAVSGMTTGGIVKATIPADRAVDQAGNLNTASGSTDNTVTWAPNTSPTANDQSVTTNEDTAKAITLAASDPETCELTFTITTSPANGTLSAISNNACTSGTPKTDSAGVTYTPNANWSGTDSFDFTVTDGGGATDTATVTITVAAVNDAPTISNIANQTTNEDTATPAIAFTVGDVEAVAGSLVLTKYSSNTILVPTANIVFGGSGAARTVTVTPAANQSGSATIRVTVSDRSLTASATFLLTVIAVNDSPTISNITNQTTNEDTATPAIDFTVGDVETAAASLTLTGGSSDTTLVPIANIVFGGSGASRTVTITPALNQSGTSTITVTVSDGSLTANDTFVLTVNAVNDPPVANNDSYSVLEEDILTVGAPGVLDNDTDIDSPALTAVLVSSPGSGTVTLNADGSFTYDPNNNFNGNDSFTYRAYDGAVAGNSATVTITVSDGTAPAVAVFSINGTSCSGSNCNNQVVVNSTFTIAWTASESGGSYLNNAKIYNAVFVNGSCDNNDKSGCSWGQVGSTVSAPASSNSWSDSAIDNPVDNTYWYGIHIGDNAQNCITENIDLNNGHCGGVSGDSLDNPPRTDRGPIKVKMQHNSSPTIQGNVGISPVPPVKAGVELTFSVDWNDPGDQVKIHICKDVLSGISCNVQGSWCASSAFTTNDPATCTYTTLAADGGDKAYNAYVCDDEGACSSAKSGTFLVDATAPVISTFSATPVPPAWISSSSPDATVSWSVSDSGGANLKQIEVWRAWDANGNGVLDTTPTSEWDNPGNGQSNPLCTKTGGPPKCTNDQNFDTVSTDSDSYIDTNLLASSIYWYGLHVVDKADNMGTESTPLKVQVDKNEPNSQIQSPASSSWFSNDFTLDTLDEDLLSGLDTAQCQYKIIPFEDTNGDGIADTERLSSGWRLRTCNAPPSSPVTPITVGSADYCKYQAKSSCWVYVRSQDVAGNWHTPTQPAGSVKPYNIDWAQPEPGKLHITVNEEDQAYPIQAQLDRSDIYKVHVTDNLKVAGCSLYIDSIDQGVMTPTVPGCETDCTFTKDFTFTGTGTYHNNYAQCKDAANNSKSGTSVDVEVKTLSVDLTAIPSSGSTNTLFDLVGTVSGTMTGNINYKFDCDINQAPTWNLEIDGSSQNPYTAVDLCQYSPPNTYTAKVFVQRGVGTAEDTVSISVSANSVPSAINLQNNNATADYCFVSSPPVILSWEFLDPDFGDSQSAYRVQVATNPGFGSPIIDTCPSPQGEAGGTCTPGHSAQAYAPPGLSYATTYYWRVKVWDNIGDSSLWATALSSFTTPVHPYPVPSFTWTPALPGSQESVQFTDQTNFAVGATGKTWSWTFGDGGSSVAQNPTHTYAQTGLFGVTLQSEDDAGSCSNSQTVNVSVPFPEWQEISPF